MEKENNGKEIKVVFTVTQEKLSSRVLINILISLSKAATSTDTNSWIESVGGSVRGRGGRKGQLHQCPGTPLSITTIATNGSNLHG